MSDKREVLKQLTHLGNVSEIHRQENSALGARLIDFNTTINTMTHELADARTCATRRARNETLLRAKIIDLQKEIKELGGIDIAGLEYQVHEAQSMNATLQSRLTEALARVEVVQIDLRNAQDRNVSPRRDPDAEVVALNALNGALQSEKVHLQGELAKAHAQIDSLCRVTDDNPNKVKALEIAAQCWCDEHTESTTMDTKLAEAMAKRIEPMLTAIDEAWAIIFHAGWTKANGEWRERATDWRDRNHMDKVAVVEDQDTEGNHDKAVSLAALILTESDVVLHTRLRNDIIRASVTHIEPLLDGIEEAWGILANAHGGNWSEATDEWRAAMDRWRSKYVDM
jgi:hypothetical protein